MADVKWIKIVTDIFDDEKILLIESLPDADSIIVIWFKLLCLAGKQNNSGVFVLSNGIPYTDQMLATIFRRKEATVTLALETFKQFGMIEVVDNAVTIPNWGKYQNFDKIDSKTAYMRTYMQEYREKQKALAGCKTNCKANGKANVSSADKNKIRLELESEKKSILAPQATHNKKFTPPSVEEVTAYCRERHNGIDPEQFVDYYTARGWDLSKGRKMKDWKAAVRTWEKNEKDNPSPSETEPVRVYANLRA